MLISVRGLTKYGVKEMIGASEDMVTENDRKNVLRPAVVLHVLYFSMCRSLFLMYGLGQSFIAKSTLTYAVELAKFFRRPVNTLRKVCQFVLFMLITSHVIHILFLNS